MAYNKRMGIRAGRLLGLRPSDDLGDGGDAAIVKDYGAGRRAMPSLSTGDTLIQMALRAAGPCDTDCRTGRCCPRRLAA